MPLLVLAVGQTQVLGTGTAATDPRGITVFEAKILPIMPCMQTMSFGAKGPQVEDLQNILKEDKTIYPEGLSTGYYGSLTQNAVKRLQAKFSLPQTGEIDKNTADVIMPCEDDVQVNVISPNGGEVWDKKDAHEISWKLSQRSITGALENIVPRDISNLWFWPKGRIDLVRSDGTFVRHVAIVNLAHQNYTWNIASSIPNGSDYKIRIGIGPVLGCEENGRMPCPLMLKPELYPRFTWGDESDGPFSITGKVSPPPPPPNTILQVIQILQDMIRQLEKAVQLLSQTVVVE